MIFNTITFLLFFIGFFILYWMVFNKNLKLQNLLLLIASYFFYAWTDWRLLSYLVAVSILNYFLGIYIEKEKDASRKRVLLFIGIIQGVGGLIYFKYFNFFIESFNDLFHSLNINLNVQIVKIIVPIGISFFTFRLLSYLLDIDKNKIKATKDWVVFFNYVSFFPSLLSGPIDKAKLLIPQLEKERKFEYNEASDGMRQILWGLFKKVVIADNLAFITNQIFDDYEIYSGSTLLLGAFLYSIQIYADFSGYTDMAIGVARLLGFKITKNFDFPLFAQNIAEFWRKWHISLTAWLTEYVFTPLSIKFRDYDKLGLIFAIVINFIVVGIWHGPNWTYVLFGFLHGLYFIPLILKGTMNKKIKTDKTRLSPTFNEFKNIIFNFILISLTFIVFRAENIQIAFKYLKNIVFYFFQKKIFLFDSRVNMTIFIIIIFIITEWLHRNKQYGLQLNKDKIPKLGRWSIYILIIFIIIQFDGEVQEFIYFQF